MCIHTASYENRDPCVFAGQIWHQLNFPGAVSIGHSICKAYVIKGACVIKSWLSHTFDDVHLFKEKKTPRHMEKMIMMFNHAGFSDNAYLYLRMRLLVQAAIFTMRNFYVTIYSYIIDAVTSFNNNFSITQYKRWRKYRLFFLSISLDLKTF